MSDSIFRIGTTAGAEPTAEATAALLARLPAWFGIPSANDGYVESARQLDGFVARAGGDSIGVLLYRRHFPSSAEIHLIAVAPEWHRNGVGRGLVTALSRRLASQGCQLLQVKTLGPSHSDTAYGQTRRFYEALGFIPLEELRDWWGGDNPCLIMVKALDGNDGPWQGSA